MSVNETKKKINKKLEQRVKGEINHTNGIISAVYKLLMIINYNEWGAHAIFLLLNIFLLIMYLIKLDTT